MENDIMRYNHALSLPFAAVLLTAASSLAMATTSAPTTEPMTRGSVATAATPATSSTLLQLASVDRPERAHRAERPEKPETGEAGEARASASLSGHRQTDQVWPP